MSRYIDAERLYTELEQLYKDNGWERMEVHFSLSDMECNIHFMPTANVRENVTGKWHHTDAYPHWVYCGNCFKAYLWNENWAEELNLPLHPNFCPNCGAKMMETKEGEVDREAN